MKKRQAVKVVITTTEWLWAGKRCSFFILTVVITKKQSFSCSHQCLQTLALPLRTTWKASVCCSWS